MVLPADISGLLLDPHQQLAALDGVAFRDENLLDGTCHPCAGGSFHLHGLDGDDGLAFLDGIADLDIDSGHSAGDGCSDLALIFRIRHRNLGDILLGFGIRNLDFAADAVELE